MTRKSVVLAVVCAWAACSSSSSSTESAAQSIADVERAEPAVPGSAPADSPPLVVERDLSRLGERFDAPGGFVRVPVEQGSYQAYLRDLELRTDRVYVLSYEQERLDSPSAAVAVLDVGTRDLQQCADAIMRLHGEWLWAEGRADEVGYHFVSGDLSQWKDWREGERFRVTGSTVTRVKSGKADDSYDNFKRYLFHVFAYAATRSMNLDSDPVSILQARSGDFFVQPGSPGHAVLILDIAEHPDGRKAAVLGQGFMPAQEFHVIEGSGDQVLDRVWFVLPQDEAGVVDTPSWQPFEARELRRFHGG